MNSVCLYAALNILKQMENSSAVFLHYSTISGS